MLLDIPRRWRPGIMALLLCVSGAAVLWQAPFVLRAWQERAFDIMVAVPPKAPDSAARVAVIDIGATDDSGAPWTRMASARLAARLAELKPAAIAYDIVFSGNCDSGAGNAALASALAGTPSVLGFLLTATATAPPQPAPVLAVAQPAAASLWASPGAESPCPQFLANGPTLGAVALRGDEGALVRKVPAAVLASSTAYPSLAVEALRRAKKLPPPMIGRQADGSLWLRTGSLTVWLEPTGDMRFRPSPPSGWASRTIAAKDILAAAAPAEKIAGAIVFVGSSLPQRGGLRPTASSPLHPSLQIQADAAITLLSGTVPHRPAIAPVIEMAALLLAGIALLFLLPGFSAVPAFGIAAALALLWPLACFAYYRLSGELLDPVFPPLLFLAAALAALLAQAAATARAERALHQRMDQLLPAPVIARLIDNPRLFRLKGEVREVTALTTDLEGFSTAVAMLPPEDLIGLLDSYFTVVSGVILRHGGMIDKFMGDGVHALFNAPLDHAGHVDDALAAAASIVTATEAWRKTLGDGPIGRTRIGIETGAVILGDVGSGAKIDYTALGPAVNLASRLQEAGKALGPAVVVGPAAAAKASSPLAPLGRHGIRSFGEVELFTLAT